MRSFAADGGGGIEAVVWTDVVQAIVLWLGGIISFVFIVTQLPEGLGPRAFYTWGAGRRACSQ